MSRSRRVWLLLLALPLYGACSAAYLNQSGVVSRGNWRQAENQPAGLAPSPATHPEAIVQVYAARAVRWRGYFGVHTWIAVKPTGANNYTVYEVARWGLRRGGTSVRTVIRMPDDAWFGNRAELLRDLRGAGVDAVIGQVQTAVQRYPYAQTYHVWPGPNSNTFTAFVLREVPGLGADLPATAIGKDYLGLNPFAVTPSGTGVQINLFGLAGVALAREEGLELNLLGLNFGIDPGSLALRLPMLGRVGPRPPIPTLQRRLEHTP